MKSIALLLGMGAVIWLPSCSSPKQKEEINSYKVISPMITDTIYTNEYVAEITAFQNVEIRSRIKGFLENILVDEGQIVRKGQTLFSISNKEYYQELLKAKAITKNILAELKSANIELSNLQKLLDNKIIGKPEFNLAEAKVEALEAKIEEAQADEAKANLNLSFTEIKAPFDGIINRIPYKKGSLIEEGTLLTTISDNKEVFAYFRVSESEYLNFISAKSREKSKEVSLVLSNGSDYNYRGIIETSESEIDRSSGNIAFRAKFPNPELVLKHGSSGKVQVKTKIKNTIVIPQKSTFEIQGNLYVFVLDKNNLVQQRKIIPSYRLQQLYVIHSGLTSNEKLIYEGIQKLKDGDVILPEYVSFSSITNMQN